MSTNPRLRDVFVLGMHTVEVSAAQFDEAVAIQWMEGQAGNPLARDSTRAHFAGLRLIEVQVNPPDAHIEWGEVGQRSGGQSRSNRQVAYDETPVDECQGRWAFFLHFVDEHEPLHTPVGPRELPKTTPCPEHLRGKVYEVPG